MKRFYVFMILILAFAIAYAIGDPYPPIKGGQEVTITSDSAGDSTYIDTNIFMGKTNGANSAIGVVRLRGPISAYAGLGNDDSAQLIVKSIGQGRTRTHATASCAAIPCSCLFAVDAPAVDSTLLGDLFIEMICVDSLSDTAVDVPYNLNWDIILK